VKVEVTIRGLEELKRELARLSDAAQGRLTRNALMAGARIAAKAARENAPVATGALKKSIKARWGAPDKRSSVKTALVNTPVFYGALVEFGTVHVAPKPYMRPAVDENQGAMVAKMAENISKGIERELLKRQIAEDQGET
jgi:HK97 gp10 family phage protein